MIHLIYGPPCSGKSTYVAEHAASTDLVVDHDLLAQAAGSDRSHNHHATYRDEAESRFDELVDRIAAGHYAEAWVIRSVADPVRRAELATYIRADDVHLVIVPHDVLIARALDREDPIATVRAINKWFAVAHPTRPKRRHPAWR